MPGTGKIVYEPQNAKYDKYTYSAYADGWVAEDGTTFSSSWLGLFPNRDAAVEGIRQTWEQRYSRIERTERIEL